MFVSDSQVLADVAACLKVQDSATLTTQAPHWTAIVSLSHVQAYNTIQGRLLARGYTQAQVLAWDRGPEYERVLGLYWALVQGGGLTKEMGWLIEKYERYLKDLDTLQLTALGVFVNPLGTAGQVTTGSFDTSRDIFSLDDNNPHLGQPARF